MCDTIDVTETVFRRKLDPGPAGGYSRSQSHFSRKKSDSVIVQIDAGPMSLCMGLTGNMRRWVKLV